MQTNGREIVRRREALGWRQVDLAAKSGVSAAWLCRIEKDEYDGSVRTIKALADALGCQVADLAANEAVA